VAGPREVIHFEQVVDRDLALVVDVRTGATDRFSSSVTDTRPCFLLAVGFAGLIGSSLQGQLLLRRIETERA